MSRTLATTQAESALQLEKVMLENLGIENFKDLAIPLYSDKDDVLVALNEHPNIPTM